MYVQVFRLFYPLLSECLRVKLCISVYQLKVCFYTRSRDHTLRAPLVVYVCLCVCVAQQVVPQRDHWPGGRRNPEKSRQPWQFFGSTQQKGRRKLLALCQVPVSDRTKPNQVKPNPKTPFISYTATHWTQVSLKLRRNRTFLPVFFDVLTLSAHQVASNFSILQQIKISDFRVQT